MSSYKDSILSRFWEKHDSVIDTHVHIGVSLSQYVKGGVFCQSIGDLILKMETLGVDFSIIFPFAELESNSVQHIYYNAGDGLFESESFPYQLANSHMLSEVIHNDYRQLLPFMILSPRKELDKQLVYFEKYKDYIFGIKIHTTANRISPRNLPQGIVDICTANHIPIVFHTRACQGDYNCWAVLDFAQRHPDINVCVAHGAGFDADFFPAIQAMENVFFDVSPLLSLCRWAASGNEKVISKNKLKIDYSNCDKVLLTLYNLAPNKLLWGTDEPCGANIPNQYRLHVAMIKNMDASMRTQIHDNVYRFLTQKGNA